MDTVNAVHAKVHDWISEWERQAWALVRHAEQATRPVRLGSIAIANVSISISMDELLEDLSYGRD